MQTSSAWNFALTIAEYYTLEASTGFSILSVNLKEGPYTLQSMQVSKGIILAQPLTTALTKLSDNRAASGDQDPIEERTQ